MLIHDTNIKVRYAETDQMGVVYHGNYIVWFEVGRTSLLDALGYTYKTLEEDGIMLPVIEVDCKYIHSAKYYDDIIIKTYIDFVKGARIKFKYEARRKDDDTLLATGSTTHAFADTNLKPIRLKKSNSRLWELLENCLRGE